MKKLVYITAIMISCVSCEDFLDLQPKDSLTPENYYNTASEVEKALNGVYHVLVLQGGADFILNAEVMTDNCVYSSASGSEWLAFTKGTLNPSTSYVATKWENNYKGIARANLVIENLNHKESMIISESDRQRFLGEAHFLRAYFYADLLNFYGGVPIVMSPLDNIKDYNLPRSAPELVLDTILYDVNIAIENLKEEAPANNLGRATKGAALFLKARVLLFNERYMESYDAQRVDLTGCTLDQVLYVINRGCPLIALTSADHAVLIIGYSTTDITYIDPDSGAANTVGINEMETMAESGGNVFIGYIR